jgi:hypothetical protein
VKRSTDIFTEFPGNEAGEEDPETRGQGSDQGPVKERRDDGWGMHEM